ncbi:MAG: DUF4190 domain-containing protein [Armatimonadetes bacterium]|nr:DUF4190 domain-containing protein [Armatimonadota bacterium]
MERYDNETRGTIALVLGILGFVGFGPLAGIPAWLVGNQAMAELPPGHPQFGFAQVGRILGIVNVALCLLGLVLGALLLAGMLVAASGVS